MPVVVFSGAVPFWLCACGIARFSDFLGAPFDSVVLSEAITSRLSFGSGRGCYFFLICMYVSDLGVLLI